MLSYSNLILDNLIPIISINGIKIVINLIFRLSTHDDANTSAKPISDQSMEDKRQNNSR